MRVVGEQRAEGDDRGATGLARDVEHGVAEAAPPQVRLRTREQDEVRARSVRGRGGELERGPADLADHAVEELDGRPVGLEVVVLVRIDRRERAGVEVLGQPGDGVGSGVAGVVPTGEAGHQHRVAELRVARPSAAHSCTDGRRWCRQPRSAGIDDRFACSSAPLMSRSTVWPIASKPSPNVLPILNRAWMPSTMIASL